MRCVRKPLTMINVAISLHEKASGMRTAVIHYTAEVVSVCLDQTRGDIQQV